MQGLAKLPPTGLSLRAEGPSREPREWWAATGRCKGVPTGASGRHWDPVSSVGPRQGSAPFLGLSCSGFVCHPLNASISPVRPNAPLLPCLVGYLHLPFARWSTHSITQHWMLDWLWLQGELSDLGRRTCLKAEGQTLWSLEISSSCKMNGSAILFTLYCCFGYSFIILPIFLLGPSPIQRLKTEKAGGCWWVAESE